MSEMTQIDFSQPIPLFSLHGCVLLPGATVSLHVFEPRYRAMVKATIKMDRLIAIALFEGDQWKEHYHGKPALRPHVCIGKVVRHHHREDGRYNLLLRGLCRAKIVEELPHDPYRIAVLDPTEVCPTLEIDLADQREQFESMLSDPLLSELALVSEFKTWLGQDIPTKMVIDLAIMRVCDNLDGRYAMLAEADAYKRFAFLLHCLRDTQHTLEVAQRYRAKDLPDGITLN